MLRSFLQPQLHQFGQSEVWFQQDGATAHTSKLSMELLTQMFPSRLICIRGDIPWPARSPDLAACCEVLKSTRKLSHGKSDRASQVARIVRLEKGADKAFPDCVIPEGLLLKFTAI
ncbi:hypothetical protein AVEN_195400-1 [Araneus ventricosus]|uniref:Tc1-like transposase DDE domain-containing protein n=1 Tax=Araneus ventricosus TaxID=182803 RepID=A0A4Y2MHB0_ARAVE|nr:hypothetical protein AVEN_195400-1 [Araneus ventricosus]